jgi:hypothetical protein
MISQAGISHAAISATRSEGRRYAGSTSATVLATNRNAAVSTTGAAISVRAGASISSSRCRPIRDSRIAITPTITIEPQSAPSRGQVKVPGSSSSGSLLAIARI